MNGEIDCFFIANILYFLFTTYFQEDFSEFFKAKDWKERIAFKFLFFISVFLGGLAVSRFFATK